jgi:tetratricopeptide (TPR) repeat protein
MRKYFILPFLLVLAVGLSAPLAFSQTTGTVKGVCTDIEGKPITGAVVQLVGVETGHTYNIKTNAKGEYFTLGIVPGKYNFKLSKDGTEIFHINNVTVGLDELELNFDLKKEQVNAPQNLGKTPEQIAAEAAERTKAAKDQNTVKALNDKIREAGAASDAGDFEKAIAVLNDANAMDSTRDLIWYKLGDAYRASAGKTDPAEKEKRYEMAVTDYQKAIEIRKTDTKDPDSNKKLAAYYNNLADVYNKTHKVDDAVKTYGLAAQIDPAGTAGYNYNIGIVYMNAGRADESVAAFDKVIAADPNKALAYYYKGIDLIGKATLKGDKMIAPDGTVESFQKYIELEPNGPLTQTAKDMLASIGATIETGFGTKKKAVKK